MSDEVPSAENAERHGNSSQHPPPKPQPQQEGQPNDEVPSASLLSKIENYNVLDQHGTSHPFKSLFAGPGVAQRVLIIFVRHFFCGSCQAFLRSLSASITPESLESVGTSTSVAVIGCGDPSLIEMYAKETGCKFPIFADPTRRLFHDLGMVCSLASGKQPDYIGKSMARVTIESMIQTLKYVSSGSNPLKSGNVSQNGGEFLFELRQGAVDGDKEVTWCHRMSNTRDHTEIPQLMEVLGMQT